MIIKSMSRKEASFGQLMDYIDRDGGEERSRIRYNLISRDRERIRAEFEQNAEHMQARKNGVYMYHEIISITRARGIDLETQKERLHQIAQEYVAARAPRNLCYGGLHDDKDHSLHYHLMISANRAGEAKRHRLSKAQFRDLQIAVERHVLETYPELEQTLAIEKTAEARVTRKEAELKRRTGEVPERVKVGERVREAASKSRDRESLLRELEAGGLELYIRGQNIGIIDRESGKRHRVKTLDAELPALLHSRMTAEPDVRHAPKQEPKPERESEQAKAENREAPKSRPAGEKEKEPRGDKGPKRDTKAQREEGNMPRGKDAPPPDPERQELIDKGYIRPDREAGRMDEGSVVKKEDQFLTKVQQSWRRTMDDFRGRTKDLEERAREERGRDDDFER